MQKGEIMVLEDNENVCGVVGFESCYKITSFGRIWSIKRDKFLNASSGIYITITLYDKGRVKNTSIHRLVAEAFINNDCKKPFVNHIDGDKHNNNISNLEWVTASENDIHAVSLGLKKNSDKQRTWARKHIKSVQEKISKKINQLTIQGELVMVHKSIRDASRTMGVTHQSLMSAIKRNGTSVGYKWEVA